MINTRTKLEAVTLKVRAQIIDKTQSPMRGRDKENEKIWELASMSRKFLIFTKKGDADLGKRQFPQFYFQKNTSSMS